MKQDDIIRTGRADALSRFRQMASQDCEGLNFHGAMEQVREAFMRSSFDKAVRLGFTSNDSYYCSASGWDRCRAGIEEQCRSVLNLLRKEHAVNQIRAVQVETTIEPMIREAALPYRIEYQKYRLKVCICVNGTRHLEFYVKYRDFNDERIIGAIPEMIRTCVGYICNYGPQLTLRRSDHSLGWTYPENYRFRL